VTLVAGVAPDGPGRGVLDLAALLARSAGDPLVVCTVVPAPWPPGPARVDAEYRTELDEVARRGLGEARERLADDVEASFVTHHARSAPAGLIEVAEQHGARLLVAGSSAAGVLGHVALGSVTDRLLHSSPLPVALAPRGFRAAPGARVTRVTAACGGAHDTQELVVAAARVAAGVGAGLRVATFAVRARPPYTSGVGREGEAQLRAAWRDGLAATARAALEDVRDLPEPPPVLEAVVGAGESWPEALEDVPWEPGDVLVVGSSSSGPLARVFLGSRAAKVVRHAPVPVVVVPRSAVAALTSS
jgi:nucleotide-binding universal stress UspA family protein